MQKWSSDGAHGLLIERSRLTGFCLIARLWNFEIRMSRNERSFVDRPCDQCGRDHSAAHPDPCLGLIPGAIGACCGHGDPTASYIAWEDGRSITGFKVTTEMWRDRTAEHSEKRNEISVTLNVPKGMDVASLTATDWENLGRFVYEAAGYSLSEQ